jgi:hypothetical protein
MTSEQDADQQQDRTDGTGEQDDGVDEQSLVDRDKIDFDPDDGLYSGTAVDGTSDIPGPHEEQDDVDGTGPPENEDEYEKQDGKQDEDSSG